MRGRLIPFQGKVLVKVIEKVEGPVQKVPSYGFPPPRSSRGIVGTPEQVSMDDIVAFAPDMELPRSMYVIGEVIQTPAPHKRETIDDVEQAFDDGPKREIRDLFKAMFSSGLFGGAMDRMQPPEVHVGDVVLFQCPATFFDKSLDILEGYEDVALIDPQFFIGRIEKEDSDETL